MQCTQQNNKIKIAIIGCGWVSQTIWIPLLNSDSDFEICMLIDSDKSQLNQAAPNIKAERHCHIDAIQHEEIDLVFITTPNHLRMRFIEYLLPKSISIFVEKPVCTTLDDYQRIRHLLLKSHAALFCSEASCLRKDISKVKQISRQQNVHDIYLIEAEWVRSNGIPNPGSWFTNKKLARGGVTLDLGWHLLDVALDIIDYPLATFANSISWNVYLNSQQSHKIKWRNDQRQVEHKPINVEDTNISMIKTDCNKAILLKTAWASAQNKDITSIRVYSKSQKISLTTTFGFSPFRINNPSIKIESKDSTRTIKYKHVSLDKNYKKQLSIIKTVLKNNKRLINNQSQLKKLKSIISIYDKLGEF